MVNNQLIIPNNSIQNGADAVAIYQGSIDDFPNSTLATTVNLIDALAYDTSDSDDDNLMALLGLSSQQNENENLQCQTCPAGFSQSNQGQPFCLPCSSGTFSIDGQSKCATKKNKKI